MGISEGPQIDDLVTRNLGEPILNSYYGSAGQRADVLEIAQEIMRRHVAKLPTDTGRLKASAKITTPRVKHKYDSRYEAVYSIGGGRADYIVPLEAEHHYLDEVLREMGFETGDIAHGPTGRVPKSSREPQVTVFHRTSSTNADRIVGGGFRPTFKEGTSPSYVKENSRYGFFTRDANAQAGYGTDVVKATVPLSAVEHDPYSGHARIKAEHLANVRFERHFDDESVAREESEAGVNSGHATQRPEPRSRLHMSDDEIRRDNLRGHLAARAAANTPEHRAAVEANRAAAIERDKAEAAEALRSARLGSKASERKFQDVGLQYKGDLITGGDPSAMQAELENHNRAREAAGLDAIPFKWEPGGDERPYR